MEQGPTTMAKLDNQTPSPMTTSRPVMGTALTLGAELGEVAGAGQDRHTVAKEGVLSDGDVPRRQG
jgi:hypothetical protein